jgi:putative ABC transport system permease protein
LCLQKQLQKIFGSIDNAMGKVLEMDKDKQLKVTGIANDVPSNSHLSFDLVVPLSNLVQGTWFNVWINNNNFTYVFAG